MTNTPKQQERSDFERLRRQTLEMIQRAFSMMTVQGGGRVSGTSTHLSKR